MAPILAAALALAGADAQMLATLTNVVTVAVSGQESLKVISAADVERVVAFEAEKEMMGCSDAESCLAEVAGAMGARWVIFGDVGKIGSRTLVTLSLFDSERGAAEERVIARASDLDELVDKLDASARKLVANLKDTKVVILSLRSAGAPGQPEPEPVPEPAEVGGGPGAMLWIGLGTTGVGAAMAGVGTLFWGQAQEKDAQAQSEAIQVNAAGLYDDRDEAVAIANTLFIAGAVVAVVGVGVSVMGVLE